MKKIEIDGNKFSNLTSFYNEVESKLTKDINWKIGRSLDAFNDILRGGVGVYEHEEPITLTWINYDKSQQDLGWDETISYIESKLTTCHPSNREFVLKELDEAREGKGVTLAQIIVGIILEHKHINFERE